MELTDNEDDEIDFSNTSSYAAASTENGGSVRRTIYVADLWSFRELKLNSAKGNEQRFEMKTIKDELVLFSDDENGLAPCCTVNTPCGRRRVIGRLT